MIESIYGGNYRLLKNYILLIFFVVFSARFSFAQKSYDINNIGFGDTKNIEEKYIYNSKLNKYIISSEVGNYPITHPIVLSVEEFEALVLEELKEKKETEEKRRREQRYLEKKKIENQEKAKIAKNKKKNTDAASIAIYPMKKVNAT